MSAVTIADSPSVVALGWALLHFLWQGALVAALYAAVRAVLPKWHCGARYVAGLAALGVLALCPLVTLSILLDRQAGVAAAAASSVQPVQGAVSGIASVPGATAFGDWLPMLVGLWVAGVIFMACRALRQWRGLARAAREHTAPSGDIEALFAALMRRFGTAQGVRLLVCARIDTPTLIGWLKPVILLPAAVALGFPRQQIELILAHELGHLRRCDHLVNLAQVVVETLLFYHPAVHWISAEVRNERELCCDALVLQQTRGEPREYARTLAALEELRQAPAMRMALAASGGVLLDRVRRIVGVPVDNPGMALRTDAPSRLLIAATIALAAALLMRLGPSTEVSLQTARLGIDWLPRAQLQVMPALALAVPRLMARIEPIRLDPSHPAQGAAPAKEGGLGPGATPQPRPAVAPSVDPALPEARDTGLTKPVEHAFTVSGIAPAAVVAQGEVPPSAAPAVTADAGQDNLRRARDTATTPAKAAAPARPVALRMVAPTYPTTIRSSRSERVETSFGIDAQGKVRDILITNSGFDSAFARAAERALRQWRFPAGSEQPVRYAQAFVFAPAGGARQGATPSEASDCIQPTGTHICRRSDDSRATEMPR